MISSNHVDQYNYVKWSMDFMLEAAEGVEGEVLYMALVHWIAERLATYHEDPVGSMENIITCLRESLADAQV